MMIGKKYITAMILLLMLLFLAACGDPGEGGFSEQYICLTDTQEQKVCNPHEIATIDGVNAIVASIRKFKKSDLEDNFYERGEGADDLYIFGENHSKVEAQTETLGAINYLAQKGGKIRLEGRDRHTNEFKGRSCALALLGMVYLTEVYEQLGKKYDPKERSDWVKETKFWQTMINTSLSYPLAELNLSKLTCGYWDDKASLKSLQITHANLTVRNQSLVSSSRENLPLPEGQKLIILGGFSHLPLGEFLYAQKKNRHIVGFPATIEDYFVMLRLPGARAFALRAESSGTTKDIFDYLKIQGNFREMLHKSLIK